MLDRAHRLVDSRLFAEAVRRGRRAGATTLVLHLRLPSAPPVDDVPAGPARVGLVVSRSVGNAVQRNQVKRRLRHLVRDRLGLLPDGSLLVVRALPASAGAPSSVLGQDLDRCLGKVLSARRDRP